MYAKALKNFNARRAAVLAAHLKRDKDYIAHRRKRRIGFLLGTIKVSVGTVLMLGLIKSAALATHGAEGYAQIVAPVLSTLAPDHFLAQAIAPDAYTQRIADALRPFVPAPAEGLAYGPSPLPEAELN